MGRVRHRQGLAAHPARRRDGLLGHHPATGPGRPPHAPQHDDGVIDVHEEEPAEGQVHGLGQQQVLAGLGDGDHLGVGRRGGGGRVARSGIAVDRVHPAVATHDLGQGHAHVPAAGAHVHATPSLAEPQPVQGRGQGSPVDVVAEAQLDHGPGRFRIQRPARMARAMASPAPDRAGKSADTCPSPGAPAACTAVVEDGMVDAGTLTAVMGGAVVVVVVTRVAGGRLTVLEVAEAVVVPGPGAVVAGRAVVLGAGTVGVVVAWGLVVVVPATCASAGPAPPPSAAAPTTTAKANSAFATAPAGVITAATARRDPGTSPAWPMEGVTQGPGG